MGNRPTKRRKPKRSQTKKKGGVMVGMRGGFKNLANSVTGAEPAKKKSSIAGTLITAVLVLAAAALLYNRFG